MKKHIKKSKKHIEKVNVEKEIEFDFSKIKDFITNKNVIKYSYLILLIIPIILTAHFRLYPADLPATEDWARNSIHNNIKNNIANQINTQFPNLPTANKQSMINDNFNIYVSEHQAEIDEGVKQSAEYFKTQFKNENGETYLLAIDPYYYYRQTKNLVETGHAWDKIEDGVAYNDHMMAPNGQVVSQKFSGAGFHVWFSTLWHKFISFFNKDITVMGSFFYVPVIISALSIIPGFFLARRAGGNFAGFFAAMIIGLHPSFLGRTAGGFSDTDAYNILFPLLITWLFIEAYNVKELKNKLILGGLAGLSVGLYSFAWSGWWYIFDFALAAMIGYVIYYLILHRDKIKKGFSKYIAIPDIKNSFLILITFLIVSGIFVTIFTSFANFQNAPMQPINGLSIKDSAKADLWPNVFTTVAELNSASLNSIINGIGGKAMFLVALLGMIMTLTTKNIKNNIWLIVGSTLWLMILISIRAKLSLLMFISLLGLPIIVILLYYLYTKNEDLDIKYAIFFAIWFLGTIYTTTKGIRFLLLMVPVFGVSFGIAIGKIYRLLVEWSHTELELNKKIGSIVIGLLFLLILISPIKNADAVATSEIPSMNDGWYNSLDKINQEAAPDAIINSWWDFGHWFKAIGDRAVTFDGASQNTPMAHWIGKTLLTNNQDEAIGILKMLDCGSNDAFETLKEADFETIESVDLLYKIINTKTDMEAIKILEDNNVDLETSKKLLELTKCNPPENYFITSEDMVGKSGVWAHFGSWDFRRALIWTEYRNLPKEEFDTKTETLGFSKNESTKMYYGIQSLTEGRSSNDWIASWPSYASGLSGCTQKDEVLQCSTGLIVNLTSMESYVPTAQGNLYPKKFAYVENGTFIVKEYNDKGTKVLTSGNGEFIGASLIKNGNSYKSILMHEAIVDSMFNRLFYFEGVDLNHFEKFSDLRDVTGSRIIVWKVNWKGE